MKAKARQAALRGSTRTRRGLFAMVCISALGLTAFLGTGAPAAAEGECPNEAIRIEQGSTHLPDCRAWEMVSLADKDRNQVSNAAPLFNGSRALYTMGGTSPGSPTGGFAPIIGTRTSAGWTSRHILPPIDQLLGRAYIVNAVTPDLSSMLSSSFLGLGNNDATPDISLVSLDGNGGQTLLHTFPAAFGSSGIDIVASEDLGHAYTDVEADADPTLPGVIPGADLVYDLGGGTPSLVSRMPATGLAPECGTPRTEYGFARGGDAIQSEHWASSDGRRVFYATRGDDAVNGCLAPMQLYMRDVAAGTTTLISGPPAGVAPDNGIDRFLQATPTGAQAFYRTSTSYDPADTEIDSDDSDMDIYRWTVGTGKNFCLTCSVPGAQAVSPTAVSEDGSHVYFSSLNKLADAPTVGDGFWPNTYVWRAGHPTIKFVARTNGVTPRTQADGYVTPDGRTLLFASNFVGLDGLTGGSNGGTFQYYRYDSAAGSVTCLSCPPEGEPATHDVPASLATAALPVMAAARPMSDDGRSIFFGAYDALVSADKNNGPDIYQWHDGSLSLITSGSTKYTPSFVPYVVSASADGRDLLFIDTARLTKEAQDDTWKLYDARINGGFLSPPLPPAPCQEQQCFGPPSSRPGSLVGSSDTVAEPGNVHAKHKKPHKKSKHKNGQRQRGKRNANSNRGGVK